MQQGINSAGAAGSTATLTDEQILGLEPEAILFGATSDGAETASQEPLAGESTLGQDPTSQTAQGSSDHADPAWLKALAAQPEAAAEARRWRQAAQDAAALDTDYFSAEPSARAALAARLHQTDPAAFRSMLADAARLLAERDPDGLAELARQLSGASSAAPNGATAKSVTQAARRNIDANFDAGQNPRGSAPQNGTGTPSYNGAGVAQGAPAGPAGGPEASPNQHRDSSGTPDTFPADTYRAFESATNDDVARQVRNSIDRTLTATLPDGIADGARRRIGEDIFRDLNATLSADRELSGKISEMLRGWRFDAATRQQLASLLTGRARNVLPEVARRVVSEWTSSVLASDRAKQARIESAASRRDITGGRLPEPIASNALRPRPFDYACTSDEQILEM